ncbi:hypothetical protein GUITHDRAFT_132899 [Guillardia theta CCMP2712]|uniref:PDZ domain-containing protein n=1 Tax=Guillardia theta (strain CCMP2712) TaxID=905079 RepID=L1JZ74_GUITC|nr:hypothetical protein GUITHDRAFT_132899 [Guillardia theta CCMP2712]EKX53866.1 hypothetical protein GUITHDRAFT_132899 [Guillardia theta CCMP2712]|eukprot:XP_005840846.1 hypothetical protein GUITHDRAFT_132899 [Guillardia theta CCMP2712]
MISDRRSFILIAFLVANFSRPQTISCVVASHHVKPAAYSSRPPPLLLRLSGGEVEPSESKHEDGSKASLASSSAYNSTESSQVNEAGVGLGIARTKDGHCIVAKILEGSSAAESGEVEIKDRIIEVDGTTVKGLSPAEVGKLLKGKEGSEVEMIVESQKRSGAVQCVALVRRGVKQSLQKTLGMGLSRNDKNQCLVSKILTGGRVEQSGGLKVGDIIVSINGVKGFEPEWKVFQGHDSINSALGSKCKNAETGNAYSIINSLARAPFDATDNKPLVKFLFSSKKEVVGVGLQAQKNVHGDFMVTSIEEGSPAASSGRIALGDVIAKVDGHVVKHLQWESLANLLSGAPGSSLSITFCRWTPADGANEGGWRTFEVNLRRQKTQRACQATMIPKNAQVYVDEGHLQQLVDMGFPEETARKALMATHNDIESAVTWIEVNGNSANKFHEYKEISMLTTAEAAAIEEEGGRVQLLGKGTNPVEQLMSLGFSRPEVEKALRKTQGRVMMAADRLLEKQSLMERRKAESEKKEKVQAKQGGFFASLLGFGSKETIA